MEPKRAQIQTKSRRFFAHFFLLGTSCPPDGPRDPFRLHFPLKFIGFQYISVDFRPILFIILRCFWRPRWAGLGPIIRYEVIYSLNSTCFCMPNLVCQKQELHWIISENPQFGIQKQVEFKEEMTSLNLGTLGNFHLDCVGAACVGVRRWPAVGVFNIYTHISYTYIYILYIYVYICRGI